MTNPKDFDKMSDKELRKFLGLGKPLPKSAWRKEVRHMSATEILRIHRDMGTDTKSHQYDLDFMRGMYPKPTKDQEILVSLLVMKDVPLNSFKKPDQKILKKLEKEKSVTIRKGKVNLTSIGTRIARGTKKIYGI